MILRLPTYALAALVLLAPGGSQTAPNFDVVSIKLSPPPPPPINGRQTTKEPGCDGGPQTGDPGRFRCDHATLSFLIQTAYNIKPYQLTALGWMNAGDATKFDIVATFPPDTSAADLRQMEQNLLAQRFGLVIHRGQKEMTTEILLVAKDGPKLTPSVPPSPTSATLPAAPSELPPDGPDGFPPMPKTGRPGSVMMMRPAGMRLYSNQQTIADLVDLLSMFTGQPVTDNTGLQGKYDITLTFSPDGLAFMAGRRGPPPPESVEAPPPQPPLDAALQQQLGLKLEHQKTTVATIVVDKAEKVPTGN